MHISQPNKRLCVILTYQEHADLGEPERVNYSYNPDTRLFKLYVDDNGLLLSKIVNDRYRVQFTTKGLIAGKNFGLTEITEATSVPKKYIKFTLPELVKMKGLNNRSLDVISKEEEDEPAVVSETLYARDEKTLASIVSKMKELKKKYKKRLVLSVSKSGNLEASIVNTVTKKFS